MNLMMISKLKKNMENYQNEMMKKEIESNLKMSNFKEESIDMNTYDVGNIDIEFPETMSPTNK